MTLWIQRYIVGHWWQLSWEGVTHWRLNQMDDVFRMSFANAFSSIYVVWFKLLQNWSPSVQLKIDLGDGLTKNHCMSWWWLSSLTHICVTRAHCVNSLVPGVTILHCKTVVQVMACCWPRHETMVVDLISRHSFRNKFHRRFQSLRWKLHI